MSALSLFVLATTAFFLTALLVRSLGPGRWKFCAVCVTISLAWLFLLSIRLFGYTVDPALIGVLMGESVVGLYYLIEKRASAAWQIFRWPYIITMTVLVYLVAGARPGAWRAVWLLVLIWVVWGAVFALRKNPSVKKIAERLVACCRDW